ncbi:MAG: hypothetical protein M3451_04355 [Chloroflexota bacterium]|nr:hypothetical protein [Chloroflexota bacterium]
MNGYRFNVIDPAGVVSFMGPRHGSKMIAAACGANHRDVYGVLTFVHSLDERWAREIERGLEAFDAETRQLNTAHTTSYREAAHHNWHRPFRVVDHVSRQASMKPGPLGLLVVNLKEHRIIQVDNRSIGLRRTDRGRVRRNGKPTRMLFRYRLPSDWAIVP